MSPRRASVGRLPSEEVTSRELDEWEMYSRTKVTLEECLDEIERLEHENELKTAIIGNLITRIHSTEKKHKDGATEEHENPSSRAPRRQSGSLLDFGWLSEPALDYSHSLEDKNNEGAPTSSTVGRGSVPRCQSDTFIKCDWFRGATVSSYSEQREGSSSTKETISAVTKKKRAHIPRRHSDTMLHLSGEEKDMFSRSNMQPLDTNENYKNKVPSTANSSNIPTGSVLEWPHSDADLDELEEDGRSKSACPCMILAPASLLKRKKDIKKIVMEQLDLAELQLKIVQREEAIEHLEMALFNMREELERHRNWR